MARARKLFPIYGSALANTMLLAIERDRVVDRFVTAYVALHDRRGILGGPARDRELAETIGREILLAMIVEVREALPAFFGGKQERKLKTEETEAIDAFFRELLAALARAEIRVQRKIAPKLSAIISLPILRAPEVSCERPKKSAEV